MICAVSVLFGVVDVNCSLLGIIGRLAFDLLKESVVQLVLKYDGVELVLVKAVCCVLIDRQVI